ncbi:MAG: hypothetical protein IJ400_00180 [Clostridia bacterium]|nr:hypothetical protein [Clostridia bacterium]
MKAYKHDIYLIERTKLLEGIVCQSIAFTNSSVRRSVPNSRKDKTRIWQE